MVLYMGEVYNSSIGWFTTKTTRTSARGHQERGKTDVRAGGRWPLRTPAVDHRTEAPLGPASHRLTPRSNVFIFFGSLHTVITTTGTERGTGWGRQHIVEDKGRWGRRDRQLVGVISHMCSGNVGAWYICTSTWVESLGHTRVALLCGNINQCRLTFLPLLRAKR